MTKTRKGQTRKVRYVQEGKGQHRARKGHDINKLWSGKEPARKPRECLCRTREKKAKCHWEGGRGTFDGKTVASRMRRRDVERKGEEVLARKEGDTDDRIARGKDALQQKEAVALRNSRRRKKYQDVCCWMRVKNRGKGLEEE
ncbi:uncharacterized protein SPSK_01280 [Sporothrix schenckii 1099-18]|uniref:Uncharacterized protein n=1 Tax=Sporothrix schenckii 1099-18 TaxID=1397361 RepID=A0A0F2LVM1_SPOSC|nr:uncharacterized protein SPSK_01280 [Sporothrix schenckii 1099-18]KJR81512.1 hypothetical protein SPSK_01280 [Sporothrix schenckii 1099-18]